MKENVEIKTKKLLLDAIKMLQENIKIDDDKNFKLKQEYIKRNDNG